MTGPPIDLLVALGLEETVAHGEGGRVEHCQLDWPEGGAVLLGGHEPEGRFTVEPGSMACYVTADPRAVHERAVAAGAEITPGAGGDRLRLARRRLPRPRGQRVVPWHLPGEPSARS